ncbi:MAG: esterase family protein [Deltaproteobacteria bacterium]|nr:esterase family protein [Deltaproteobacteria bacterium]
MRLSVAMVIAFLAVCFWCCVDEHKIEYGDVSQDISTADVSYEDIEDVSTDISEDDVQVPKRLFKYRAFAGVSMGACGAGMIGLRHVELFDIIGVIGGYVDWVYLLNYIEKYHMGGFCPMEQILANIEDINDPNKNPNIYCGKKPPINPVDKVYLEWEQGFNHWYFFDSGGAFDRDEYIKLFQDLSMALGNPGYYNEFSPYLPSGIKPEEYLEWIRSTDRCIKPIIIDNPPYNCNAEYNPECKYPLISFCDGEEPIDKKDPKYYEESGKYDPYYPKHDNPFVVVVAVDYNRNGLRDYGEPVVLNSHERFKDTGVDGCFDEDEDGNGGCCTADKSKCKYDKETNPDPNRDNYDVWDRFNGTEKNGLYDEGEPFNDYGLDGVKADVAEGIPSDYGEDNGKFDYSPNVLNFFAHDMRLNILRIAKEDINKLKNLDIYIDGGIRDIFLSAAVSSGPIGALKSLGLDARVYDDFFSTPTSILPGVTETEYMDSIPQIDFSRKKFGRYVLVRYGNPDATKKQILDGDGAHVGTASQVINRFLTFLAFTSKRFPKWDKKPVSSSMAGLNQNKWFYSKSLGGYRRYAISLPPGYFDEENKDKRYPVVYLMHGYGMEPGDMGAAGSIFQTYMAQGALPKFIIVYPDGKCCYKNIKTDESECGCTDSPNRGMLLCVGKDGKERDVPEANLVRQCNRGSFYTNAVSNIWAQSRKEADKFIGRYEDSLIDLIEYIDKNYRTRLPEEVEERY